MMITAVDKLYDEFRAIIEFLETQEEYSFALTVDDQFRKSLLISAASEFETSLTSCVHEYCKMVSRENLLIPEFVRNKAIARQYYTWFEWDRSNANSFFGLFGADFKARADAHVRSCDAMKDSISDFLELGRDRNRMVHQNFVSFSLEKTPKEIYNKYKSALRFVRAMPNVLAEGPECISSIIKSL